MAHSIEIRCPFLDKKIYEITKNMEYDDFFEMINNKIINKNILRKAFSESLPDFIVNRTKTSFDVGTGLRKLVVEYLRKDGMTEKDHLKMIWCKAFPYFANENDSYFHSYPVFDEAISQRGAKHL
jgi:asparagine synthase (glutamine-hydrolysing)